MQMKHHLFSLSLITILTLVSTNTFSQKLNLDKYKNKPQTVTGLRVASAAVLPEKWDKETNWMRIEKMVREAAVMGGAELVVTPEGILEGYVINEVNAVKGPKKKKEILERFKDVAEKVDGEYITKACKLSEELGIYLVLGFLEDRNSKLYNTVILIDPEGDIVGRYSKTHFAQGYEINPDVYTAGDEYPVFDTPFGKVGMIICYDRQLPEPARIMALKGAQVLFVPAYGSYTEETGWNTVLMRTRAYENEFPVVFCNPFQSLLIDDDGDIRAFGNAGEIVYYKINTDPKRYTRRFRNRRPASYGEFTEGNDPVRD
jgi:predicted amidohydrolase